MKTVRGAFAIWLVFGASACDQVFGLDGRQPDAPVDIDLDGPPDTIDALALDLDGDGVIDDVDPCVNAAADLVGDSDQDGIGNATDTCPYDANGSDLDMDGLGSACDPFPTAGDRSRCLMRFSSPGLNTALWPGRASDLAWTNSPGMLIADPPATGNTFATAVAAVSIEGETLTSYDLVFHVNSRSRYGSITVWVRADPAAPSPSDIGCRWVNEMGGGPRIAVVQGSTLLAQKTFVSPPTSNLTIGRTIARVVTTGALGSPARVTCIWSFGTTSESIEASPPLPAGRFGLTVDRWLVDVSALHVMDRVP